MFRITTLNTIAKSGLLQLPESYDISAGGKKPDGIILRSFQLKEKHLTDGLLAVARAGAGVNNIPIEDCSQKGIVVFNTPGANANAVKELVVAGMLLSTRRIVDGINWMNSIKGQENVAALVEKGKSQFTGPELNGKTICVIGLGAIGVMVANIANSLKMNVLGYDPFMTVDAAWGLSRSVHKAVSLEAILPECDFVTLHMPLTGETKGMINRNIFNIMKKGARLLNFARAELVDYESLSEALSNGTLTCYVTDFPTPEVLDMLNVIAIPHLGASTPESEENCAQMAAIQLRDYLESGTIENSVNFPSLSLMPCENKRILVLHKNIPHMIGQITGIISKYRLNIDNMINKNKGSYACTVVDVDELTDADGIIEGIMRIAGVVKVRII